MNHLRRRGLQHRMVALSLLPPPSAHEPLRPFGFGAFIIEPGLADNARFALDAHGYGAGYDPARMRADLRALFDPETFALVYMLTPATIRLRDLKTVPYPAAYRDLLPRSGLRSNIFVPAPRHLLANAGGTLGLKLTGGDPAPLHRLHQIGAEAQAAWSLWLFIEGRRTMRRSLLASHAAWLQLEKAKSWHKPKIKQPF